MVKYCSVKNCFNSNQNHKFLGFPDKFVKYGKTNKLIGIHPHKGKLFEKWARFCGEPSLFNIKPCKTKDTLFVCDIHFEPQAFQNPSTRDQLIWYAVPTLHGPVFDSDSQCLLVPDLSEGIYGRDGRIISKKRFLKTIQLEKEDSLSLTCSSELKHDNVTNRPYQEEKTNLEVDSDCTIKFGSIKDGVRLDKSLEVINETQPCKQKTNSSGFPDASLKEKKSRWSDEPGIGKNCNSISEELSEFIVDLPNEIEDDSRLSNSPSSDCDPALVLDHSYSAPKDKRDSNQTVNQSNKSSESFDRNLSQTSSQDIPSRRDEQEQGNRDCYLPVNQCNKPSDSSCNHISIQDITGLPNRRGENRDEQEKQNVFTKDIFFCGECQRMFNSFEKFMVHKLTEEKYKMTFETTQLVKGLWIPKLYKKSKLDLQVESEKDDDECSGTSPRKIGSNQKPNRSMLSKAKYQCSKCDKSFAIKAPLIKHYFKIHGK